MHLAQSGCRTDDAKRRHGDFPARDDGARKIERFRGVPRARAVGSSSVQTTRVGAARIAVTLWLHSRSGAAERRSRPRRGARSRVVTWLTALVPRIRQAARVRATNRVRVVSAVAAWPLAIAVACGGDPPHTAETGALAVVAEPAITTPAPIGPNPVTGDATPEAFQHAVYYRYRLNPGQPVRAVIVLVPGIASGASDFDYLARELLRRSGGTVEVWAFERRPNRLEDLTGMEEAERVGRAPIAADYYFAGGEVEGRRFAGFLAQSDVPFLSEWGIGVVMRDLMAAIADVPVDRRRTNVVLIGHSLGVVQVLDFLGWDFDGDAATTADAGYAQVAASALIDAPILASEPSLGRDDYTAALTAIRDGRSPRYDGLLPMLNPEALALAEILGMRAHPRFDDPADPTDGPRGMADFASLPSTSSIESLWNVLFAQGLPEAWLGLPPRYGDFTLTNEALLGMVFDDDFQPWNPLQISAGFVTPADRVVRRAFPPIPLFLDPGLALADPSIGYGWTHRDELADASPGEVDGKPELTEIERLAEAQWRGPSNYTEWYFATRPMLDGSALGTLATIRADDWQSAEYGLDLFHTARIDVPLLSLGGGAGMAPTPALHEAVRHAVADPARNGQPRSSDEAFRVRIFPGYTHFDLLLADDSSEDGNRVFEEILSFALAHTEGEVLVP